MDAVAHIQRLGWEWRPDGMGLGVGPGVVLSVRINGRDQQAFVPLARVWLSFDQELQKVGCASSASVGAPFSVGGFFSFIKKAASSVANVAKSAFKAVVPRAIQRAAARIANIAKRAASSAFRLVKKIPVLGTVVTAGTALALLPARAAGQLLSGKRIDRIAVDQFKGVLSNVKTLAPYVQTVVSFVPGIGTGISAGLGGALALASGKRIDQAMLEAARAALPGGPAAQAAFAVAEGVIQGKPIDQIALNALPIPEQQKALLIRGVSAAKALASGQRVDQVLLDQALKSLPPEAQKAVQIGVALGHAKSLQEAAGAAANGALGLASSHSAGVAAAQQYARGLRTPAVLAAMRRGYESKGALSQIVRHAQSGHPQAQRLVNAMRLVRAPYTRPLNFQRQYAWQPAPRPFHHPMRAQQAFPFSRGFNPFLRQLS